MVTADYHTPDWGCLVDFFYNQGLKTCWHGWPGIEPTTLDSGVYDLSATANKFKKVKDDKLIILRLLIQFYI